MIGVVKVTNWLNNLTSLKIGSLLEYRQISVQKTWISPGRPETAVVHEGHMKIAEVKGPRFTPGKNWRLEDHSTSLDSMEKHCWTSFFRLVTPPTRTFKEPIIHSGYLAFINQCWIRKNTKRKNNTTRCTSEQRLVTEMHLDPQEAIDSLDSWTGACHRLPIPTT